MQKRVYVSTGEKSVLHTLWSYSLPEVGDNFQFRGVHCFIKNLSADPDLALKEAKEYAKELNAVCEGIEDSPTRKWSKGFDFAGVHFIRKRTKFGWTNMGQATSEFFTLWKEKKDELKAQGYSLSKYKDVWFVFFKEKGDK